MRKFLISLSTVFFLAFLPTMAGAETGLKPLANQSVIEMEVVSQFQKSHYGKVDINDAFSEQVLHSYLDALDGTHSIFLASDIADLTAKYGHAIDDQLKNGELTANFAIYNLYHKRRIAIDNWLLGKIKDGIDKLDLDDGGSFSANRKEAPWPADEAAQKKLWLQQLKSHIIDMRLSDIKNEDIQKQLTQRYNNELARLKQVEPTDAFASYMSAYAKTYDPHTNYLSPNQSEELNISLNLSLKGIGAELRSENGYAEIVRLIAGGPASKNGQLKPTDKIIAVAQGKKGEFTDVVGLRLDDTVRLIRGKIGTTVRLQVKPGDGGENKIISIVRDEVALKDQAASKKIITLKRDGKTQRIGLIRLPTFYNGTTRDIKKLLIELKKENVKGVIVDLRNNGGGSLDEVVNLVGLFMGPVPAVQIRDAKGQVQVAGDQDAEVVFAGPMAVMVNRLSASASEIFAAAMQDYGRAVIVGSQTFGKGTVQSVMPLSRDGKKGLITLTQAKFYRISGDSTQRHGVTPDIDYPSFIDAKEIGEEILPHALPWDKIRSLKYPKANFIQHATAELTARHEARVRDEPDFEYLAKRIELARDLNQHKDVSLNINKRKAEQQELQQRRLALVNAYRKETNKPPFKDFKAFEKSEDKAAPADDLTPSDDASDKKPDGYQKETANIVLDIIDIFAESGRPKVARR